MKRDERHPRSADGRVPEDASSSGVVPVPAVRASSVLGTIGLLEERGGWPAVRGELLRRDPFATHWVDRVTDGAWCPLDRATLLMDAAHRVLGGDEVRALGNLRFRRATETGVLAPMLRSWARSVVPDAALLVKLTPHLWRAASQSLGDIKVLESRPGAGRIRFTTDHPGFVHGAGWHRFFEGFVLGLLAMRDRDAPGMVSGDEARCEPHDDRVEMTLRWSP